MPPLSIYVLTNDLECVESFHLDDETLDLPSDWKMTTMHGMNMPNTTAFTACFHFIAKVLSITPPYTKQHPLQDAPINYDDILDEYVSSHADCPVYAVVYDDHLLYGDMLNNMTSFDTHPDEIRMCIHNLLQELEAVSVTKITHSPLDDAWCAKQITCAADFERISNLIRDANNMNMVTQ